MCAGDDTGSVKYWQANFNHVKVITAHREAVRAAVHHTASTNVPVRINMTPIYYPIRRNLIHLIGHFLFNAEKFIVTQKNIRLRVAFKRRV